MCRVTNCLPLSRGQLLRPTPEHGFVESRPPPWKLGPGGHLHGKFNPGVLYLLNDSLFHKGCLFCRTFLELPELLPEEVPLFPQHHKDSYLTPPCPRPVTSLGRSYSKE